MERIMSEVRSPETEVKKCKVELRNSISILIFYPGFPGIVHWGFGVLFADFVR